MKKMYRPILHLTVCSFALLIPLVSLAGRPGGGGGGGGNVSRIHYVADGMTYSMNADGSGKQLEATVALEGPLSAKKYSGGHWQLWVGTSDDWFEAYYDNNGNGRYDAPEPPEPFVDANHNGQYDPGEEFVDVNGNGKHDFEGLTTTFPGQEVFASRWTDTGWQVIQVTSISGDGLHHFHYGGGDVNVAWSNDGQDSFLSVRVTGFNVDADGRYLRSTSRPQYIARINVSGADLDTFAGLGFDPLIAASGPEFEIVAADPSATIENYSQVFTSHSWSPDGKKLVIGYSGTSANPGAELFVWDTATETNPTGTGQFLLRAVNDGVSHSWAPNGSRIMIDDGSDILLISPDGTGLATLLDGSSRSAWYSDGCWSPDGQWIAYRKLASMQSICKIPAAGGKEVNLTKDLGGIRQWPLGWTAN